MASIIHFYFIFCNLIIICNANTQIIGLRVFLDGKDAVLIFADQAEHNVDTDTFKCMLIFHNFGPSQVPLNLISGQRVENLFNGCKI